MFVVYSLSTTIPVKNILIQTVLQEYYNEGIEMICVDGLKYHYDPILIGITIDYKEQVLITVIKTNIQCSVCHIFPDKRENLTKIYLS